MDLIRLAAEVASLTLHTHPMNVWLRIDANRIAKGMTNKCYVDALFDDTDRVLATIWEGDIIKI